VKVEECWSFVELGVPFRRVGWELDAIKLNRWFLVLEQSDCHPNYDIANVDEKDLGDRSRQNWRIGKGANDATKRLPHSFFFQPLLCLQSSSSASQSTKLDYRENRSC